MTISLYKTNRTIAIIAIFLICALHADAMHESIPTIRYDRVWECTSSYDFHTYTVKYMKFDGTEEINGKIYHRIVTFRKAIMEKKHDPILDTYEYIDGLCELEGYMREDNGKVYTLASGVYYDNGLWCGCLYPLEHLKDGDTIAEFLIYDFTREPGEQYDALSNMTRSNELVKFTVISKSTVLIDNEECFHISAGIPWFEPYLQIIEGIGPILFGCLNYQEHAFPAMMWEYNYFNRVFDTTGKVLYERQDAYDYKLPENLFSSVDKIKDSGQLQFNGETITFGRNTEHNSVDIYNSGGCLMRTVSADYPVSIPTTDLAPGIYIVYAKVGNAPCVRKKIIVR